MIEMEIELEHILTLNADQLQHLSENGTGVRMFMREMYPDAMIDVYPDT